MKKLDMEIEEEFLRLTSSWEKVFLGKNHFYINHSALEWFMQKEYLFYCDADQIVVFSFL